MEIGAVERRVGEIDSDERRPTEGGSHEICRPQRHVDQPRAGEVRLLPEGFVEFTTPRSGIYGAVVSSPQPYSLERFVAFTMSDGCNYDFTQNIAPALRLIVTDDPQPVESKNDPTGTQNTAPALRLIVTSAPK